jgi:hypothetical protein
MAGESMKYRCLVALGLLNAVLFGMVVHAQENPPMVKDNVAWARDFMRTMYPGLNDKKSILTVETYLPYDRPGAPIEWFRLTIGDGPKGGQRGYNGGCLYQLTPQPPSKNGQPSPPILTTNPRCPPSGPVYFNQLLEGRFWFNKQGHLTNFAAIPSSRKEENALIEYALAHPKMTQAEAAAELKARGAKYSADDKQTFIRNLPLAQLGRFLGKLQFVSADIPVWSDCNLNPDTCLQWTVKAKSAWSDGTQVVYELGFEQLSGDLWEIKILEPAPTN